MPGDVTVGRLLFPGREITANKKPTSAYSLFSFRQQQHCNFAAQSSTPFEQTKLTIKPISFNIIPQYTCLILVARISLNRQVAQRRDMTLIPRLGVVFIP